MKKYYLIFLLLLTASFAGISSSNSSVDNRVIEILRIDEIITRGGLSSGPEGSINDKALVLSFFGGGMYQISITNSFGTLVYADILPADGMEYSYDLSGIGEGMFRLVLEGPGGEYEGYFNL
jgi:hypothetical protein